MKEVDLQSWFCGDLALLQETVEAVMEAGETCWVRSGVAGGQLTSQRTFCPRDVSCRTDHSLNSGGTGHISSHLSLVSVLPCKCRMFRCCVGEAAGTQPDLLPDLLLTRSLCCLEAQELASVFATVHQNLIPLMI